MTVVTYSKDEFNKKYAWVDEITSDLSRATAVRGLWATRLLEQTMAQERANKAGYYEGLAEKNAIQTDPKNIERWRIDQEMIIANKKTAEKKKEMEELDFQRQQNFLKLQKEKELQDDEDFRLNTEFRINLEFALNAKRELEKKLLEKSQELESFYEIDESSKVESIPSADSIESISSIDSVNSINSMPKQIPLETVTPVLAVLGIGLVSYYLLKGNKK
jgi:hypothetical protein